MKLSKKYRGHGLHIWCGKCRTNVTANPCSHEQDHRFRTMVWDTIQKKQGPSKIWESKNVKEVWKMHNDFKAEMKANNFMVQKHEKPKLITLYDCSMKYLDFLDNVDVPEYEKKVRSKEYIAEQTLHVKRFLKALNTRGIKTKRLHVDISPNHVDVFHQWLSDEGYSNTTYNKHMNTMRMLYNYLVNEGYATANPFAKVSTKSVVSKINVVSDTELITLLKLVGPGKNPKGTKDYYRPWLADAIKLGALTGERRDGLALLQWKHVHPDRGHLKIPNFKVNKLKKTDTHSYVPIWPELAQLLSSLGYGDDDAYIIAPNETNRTQVKDILSRGFTQFWKLAGFKEGVTFKHLRKTYETKMEQLAPGRNFMLGRHSNPETKRKHYVEPGEIAAKLSEEQLRLYGI